MLASGDWDPKPFPAAGIPLPCCCIFSNCWNNAISGLLSELSGSDSAFWFGMRDSISSNSSVLLSALLVLELELKLVVVVVAAGAGAGFFSSKTDLEDKKEPSCWPVILFNLLEAPPLENFCCLLSLSNLRFSAADSSVDMLCRID